MKLREQVDLVELLSSFEKISIGNSGFRHEMTAPSQESVKNSKILIRLLFQYDFIPEKVVPSGAGGVTFFYYNGKENPAMFEVQNDGKVWAGYINSDATYLERVDLDNFDDSIIDVLKDRIE